MIYFFIIAFVFFYVGLMLSVNPLIKLVSCKKGHARWWFRCDICKKGP